MPKSFNQVYVCTHHTSSELCMRWVMLLVWVAAMDSCYLLEDKHQVSFEKGEIQ